MKEKIVTKELAQLYEKQDYLEDALSCYRKLYEKTKDKDIADAIDRLKNKIGPDKFVESDNKSEKEKHLKEFSEIFKDILNSATEEDKDAVEHGDRAISLFEQWANMIVLDKKIQNFNESFSG